MEKVEIEPLLRTSVRKDVSKEIHEIFMGRSPLPIALYKMMMSGLGG
jgi:hypothetical protein